MKRRMVLCAHCAGNGRLQGGPCFYCKGSGELPALSGRHTLRIDDDGPRFGVRSTCSCGTEIAFIAGELFYALPALAAREQARVIDQWQRHRPRPRFDPPDECTVVLQGGPEDGRKVTVSWQTYRMGVFVRSGPVAFSPAMFSQSAEKEHVYTVEQRTYVYTPDWRNPLIWSC